jgi:AbiU2
MTSRWARDMESVDKQIEYLDQEVSRAVSCYYVLRTIHREMSRNPSVHDALNLTSWAWSHILFSLQCAFFIQFERVFDGSSRHSVDKIVDASVNHARDSNPKRVRGLLRLRHRLGLYSKRAEPYRKIRRQVFAHPAFPDPRQIDKLFEKTELSDIETILRFLQRCVSSLRMYILNGHDVNLRRQRLPLKDNVIADTKRFLEQLGSPTKPRRRLR